MPESVQQTINSRFENNFVVLSHAQWGGGGGGHSVTGRFGPKSRPVVSKIRPKWCPTKYEFYLNKVFSKLRAHFDKNSSNLDYFEMHFLNKILSNLVTLFGIARRRKTQFCFSAG
jgi:hypothetical protein